MTDTESTDSTDSKRLLEAALFMASEPLELDRLSKIVGISSLGYLKGILTELEQEYQEKGFHLQENREGWIFQVDNRFLPHVASLTPYSDLPEGHSRAAGEFFRRQRAPGLFEMRGSPGRRIVHRVAPGCERL